MDVHEAYAEFNMELREFQYPSSQSLFAQPWFQSDVVQSLQPFKFWDTVDKQNQHKRLPKFGMKATSRVVSQSPCERSLKRAKRMALKNRAHLQKEETAINSLDESGETMAVKNSVVTSHDSRRKNGRQ